MDRHNAWWRSLMNSPLAGAGLALLLIMAFNLFFTPGFFRVHIQDNQLRGSLVDILVRGAPLMLMALGMTLVIATGGVDLSVGPVAAITGAVAAALIGGQLNVTQMPLPLVLLMALLIAILCGIWNGVLVAYIGIQPIVATLILMVAGRGIAQLITQGQILTIYYPPYHFLGAGYWFLPFSMYLVIAIFISLSLFVRRTALGLFIEAIGVSASASYYSGINEKNIKLLAYGLCGLCAGIAGILISANIRSADANNAGLWYELDAILAVVIGGTALSGGRFSLVGSLLGALIIQSLTTTIYRFGVPPEVTLVVKAGVVFTVSLLQAPGFRKLRLGRSVAPKGAAQ